MFMEGEIISGKETEGQITQEAFTRVLRKIRKDEKYKALVLRINSPGGNALVADNIWRELKLFKETGRPIVVSMGDYAASGGYYLAAPADKIYANENTLTGSIGVFGMIPNIQGLADKVGIKLDTVNITRNATAFNLYHPFGETESGFIKENLNRTYEQFLAVVAEGRNMTRDEVHEIAQGRVWSGGQAVEKGLVDEIGSLNDAVVTAADLAGLDAYRLVEYPKIKSPVERIMELMNGESQRHSVKMTNMLQEELGVLFPLYEEARSLALMKPGEAMVRLPYKLHTY